MLNTLPNKLPASGLVSISPNNVPSPADCAAVKFKSALYFSILALISAIDNSVILSCSFSPLVHAHSIISLICAHMLAYAVFDIPSNAVALN